MRLTIMADEGYQHQIEFLLPVGSGLSTDLESDSFGWSWSPVETGWENDWHVSSSRNHTLPGSTASSADQQEPATTPTTTTAIWNPHM